MIMAMADSRFWCLGWKKKKKKKEISSIFAAKFSSVVNENAYIPLTTNIKEKVTYMQELLHKSLIQQL